MLLPRQLVLFLLVTCFGDSVLLQFNLPLNLGVGFGLAGGHTRRPSKASVCSALIALE